MTNFEKGGGYIDLETVPTALFKSHINRYIFASKFAKDKTVLDIACGAGYGSFFLKKMGAKRVVGVDISKKAIEHAKNNYCVRNLDFVCADATDLSFLDGEFDLVVSFETIEHIKNYTKFLLECNRVLKKQGNIILSTPNKKRVYLPLKTPANPSHVQEFGLDEFNLIISDYFSPLSFYSQNTIHFPKKILKTVGTILYQLLPSKSLKRTLTNIKVNKIDFANNTDEIIKNPVPINIDLDILPLKESFFKSYEVFIICAQKK